MFQLSVRNIASATLMQLGALSFLFTLLFKPKVLTAYTSEDILLLSPLVSTEVTVAAMVLTGLVCLSVLPRCSNRAIAVVLAAFVLVPLAICLLVLLVYQSAVPPLASIVLGMSCSVQVYCFVRSSNLGTSELLLSSGICLALAALFSHLAYVATGLHFLGTALLALLLAFSGFLLGRQERDLSQKTAAIDEGQEQESIRDTIRGSLATGLPVLFESLFVAFTLGTSWNQQEFDALGSNSPLFLVGIVLSAAFVFVLFMVWRKTSTTSFLMYSAAFPATLAILLNIIGGNDISPLVFVIALLSEFCFLALAWIGVLILDKSPTLSGVLASFYLLVFIAAFGISLLLSLLMPLILAQKLTAVLAVFFLLYLLFYALYRPRSLLKEVPKSPSLPSLSGAESANIHELLSSECTLLAREHGLSARETELLPLFVVGLSSTEIGRRMFISPETVKTHRKRVYQKLSVASHQELYDLLSISREV
ncbi:MAG: helix-turn-helix transcriptional regulator [Coriobacteriales bacterium]|nr:helix-turn-helix transcriptional regulator [Coriobacteriales bacterium]